MKSEVGMIGRLAIVALTACGLFQPVVVLARLGALDRSFGQDGTVETSFASDAIGYAVVIQRSGKIIVVGTADAEFALARYKKNGKLDPAFGTGGKVLPDWVRGGAIRPAGQHGWQVW